MWDPTAITIGLCAGILVGAIGVGGAAVTTPALILILKIPAAIAVGTDLALAALTKLGGAITHWRLGQVDPTKLRWLLAGSVPASVLALVLLHYQLRALSSHLLLPMLGFALLLASAAITLKVLTPRLQMAAVFDGPRSGFRVMLLGAAIAVLVALTSVGSGSVLMAALMLGSRLPARLLIGTDVAHAAIITGIDALGYASFGAVDTHLLVNLLVGSVPGAILGAHCTAALSERWLRLGIAATLATVGLQMV